MAKKTKKQYDQQRNIDDTKSVYEIVTEKIVSQLDNMVVPWHKPWLSDAKSWVTNKPYSLLNQLLCDKPGYYLTFKQIEKRGGKLKKGSKGTFITFYKRIPIPYENDEGEEETKVIPMLRYYYVFHQDDIEGIPFYFQNEIPELETPERIVKTFFGRESAPTLSHRYKHAAFRPDTDTICMPNRDYFESSEHYYATLFHEMIHSTGKRERCDRPLDGRFGNEVYSKEELIAEMGSAMLCQMCGIASDILVENSVAYIQNWMSAIDGDKKLVVQAAGKAQKAVDYILYGKGEKQDMEEEIEDTKQKIA